MSIIFLQFSFFLSAISSCSQWQSPLTAQWRCPQYKEWVSEKKMRKNEQGPIEFFRASFLSLSFNVCSHSLVLAASNRQTHFFFAPSCPLSTVTYTRLSLSPLAIIAFSLTFFCLCAFCKMHWNSLPSQRACNKSHHPKCKCFHRVTSHTDQGDYLIHTGWLPSLQKNTCIHFQITVDSLLSYSPSTPVKLL